MANKTVTLNQIKAKSPCEGGWKTLLKSLDKKRADNTSVTIGYIAKSNSVSDSLWVLYNVLEGFQKEKAYLMADIAESVAHIYNDAYPNDTRVSNCIQAIRDFADGNIDLNQLSATADAVQDARVEAGANKNRVGSGRVNDAVGSVIEAADATVWATAKSLVTVATPITVATEAIACVAIDAFKAATWASVEAKRDFAINASLRRVWVEAMVAEEKKYIDLIIKYFG